MQAFSLFLSVLQVHLIYKITKDQVSSKANFYIINKGITAIWPRSFKMLRNSKLKKFTLQLIHKFSLPKA